MMKRLVDRFGRTGFAAVSSVIWFLPMAAWAGSFDLSPMDRTAEPWIALGIGIVMLGVWIYLLTRLRNIAVAPRQHRFDLAQMTQREKRWSLVTFVFAAGLIAWLNGAATVDWTPLVAGVAAGKTGTIIFATGLAIFLVAMLIGVALSWREESAAYRDRLSRASSPP